MVMMMLSGLQIMFIYVSISFLKQEVMKVLIMVEFLYLCIIVLLGGVLQVSGWLVMGVMVFSALEGVIGLSLFMVMGKYKSGLSLAKFYYW